MALQKAIFFSFGFGSALALAACGNTAENPAGAGGVGGMGGMGGAPSGGGMPGGGAAGAAPNGCGVSCTDINYACYTGGAPVSLRKDVLPLFGLSCVPSGCHSAKEKKAGLNLGYKCAYDVATKNCIFPTTPDPDSSKPQPEDEATIADIYASLLAPAVTVKSPITPRVKPGDPEHSFFVQKLGDTQGKQGYMCENADSSHESPPIQPCGVYMPQNQELLCQGTSRPRFDTIARWIAQGAVNN
jgi:hypothetical protein